MSYNSKRQNNDFYIGFPPFIDEKSEILILGSFPSVPSRMNGFYYGNPRNRFWSTLADIYGERVPQTIEEKKALLTKHHIALWDVVEKASFDGSSDSKLEKSLYEFADIGKLLENYPNIKKIFCNGKLAHKLFNRQYENSNLTAEYLPSTSPANTSFDIEKWRENIKSSNG